MDTRGLASALALAGGFAQGQRNIQKEDERRKDVEDDRSMRKQEFDARMEEANQQKTLRIGLANALSPLKATEVTDIDPAAPDAPRKTSFSLSDGRTVGTQAEVDAATAEYNKPGAEAARQAKVLRANGAPERAITLENATFNQKRAQEQYTAEQRSQAAKLHEEGVFKAVRAFRSGDASAMAEAFNSGGDMRLDGPPEVTKEMRDVPGIGKIPTYNAKLRIVDADGKVHEKTYNSHDLSLQLMPYEKALELQRKGTDSDNKSTYQSALIDAKSAALEAKTAAAASKASGQPSREERLRYTSLFSDAGRRMSEAQRALSSLQKDPMFMMNAGKAGTSENQQIQDLRDSIKSYGDERNMYQGLLAGSQTSDKPSLADAKVKTPPPAASPKAGNGKPDYSNLWTK